MTNNVVVQFSCSLDIHGKPKEYQVVSGSHFSEEYNETLDSGALVLSQVKKEDRLSNIKSYDFARVFDKSSPYNPTTGRYEFDKIFLVDNFEEKEDNIEEHLFSYTINLMSETKLLEKFQCPNLTITHKLDSNGRVVKKTIFEHIKQYMELFVPKMKFSEDGQTWHYCPLIEVRSGEKHSKFIELSRIEARDFTPVGNEWELNTFASLSFFHIDDIYLDSLVIKNIRTTGDITFGSLTVTFDKENERFVIYGITSQLPQVGEVYISFDIDYCDTTFSKRFDVPCADFAFSSPTLRQVITTLMQQVGCIPTVNNRVLGYLDFQKEAVPFGGDKGYKVDNTVNYITRSLSSDSFVNTLVNMSSNVLDSGNKVICESLGFRDLGNVLLKQEENLYLETKFPIYKVNSFVINAYVNSKLTIKNIRTSPGEVSAGGSDHIAQWSISISQPNDTTARLSFAVSFNHDTATSLRIDGHFVAFNYKNDSKQVFDILEVLNGQTYTPGVDDVFDFEVGTYDKFYFYGRLTVIDNTRTYASGGFDVFVCNFNKTNMEYLCLYTQDITKLLVENSVRQNLSTNFSQMVGETSGQATIETLAKYVYGTVGYSIGSKKIEGFSNVYNVGSSTVLGWIQANYTYLENIWNFITTNYTYSISSKVRSSFGDLPIIHDYVYQDGQQITGGTEVNFEIISIKPYNPCYINMPNLPRIFSSNINFTYFWFDIVYQPLNSFNLSYVKSKEDIDYALEQYDSNVSGLTDFDRMSINEQEQVDRVGNEVLAISQRTTDSSLIQDFKKGPLYFEDDTNRNGEIENKDKGVKYIIFKRSFTINNNHFEASYVGSKDSILKNYFTSIRTKYRAYQYVDYNSSVLRKEKDVFYAKISEKGFYDGDDRVFFGSFTSQNLNNQTKYLIKLLGSWTYNANGVYTNVSDENYFGKATCCVLSDEEQQTKNDISIVSTNNFFAIVMEEADNVGSGTYIRLDALEQAFGNYQLMLGGVPQSWQICNDNYNEEHIVSYVSEINMKDVFDDYVDASIEDETEIYNDMKSILKMPILDEKFANLFSNDTQNVVLSVVKNNKSVQNNSYKRVFYKDGAERINHTIQFIYYTDSENIIWNENFFNLNGIAGILGVRGSLCLIDIQDEDFKLNNEEYVDNSSKVNTDYHDIITFHDGSDNNSYPYIQINWNHIDSDQFKVTAIDSGRKRDVIAFKKGENDIQKFFITLNDTKTDYVLSERNGILFRRYKVKLYTSKVNNSCPRVAIPIYDEED